MKQIVDPCFVAWSFQNVRRINLARTRKHIFFLHTYRLLSTGQRKGVQFSHIHLIHFLQCHRIMIISSKPHRVSDLFINNQMHIKLACRAFTDKLNTREISYLFHTIEGSFLIYLMLHLSATFRQQ